MDLGNLVCHYLGSNKGTVVRIFTASEISTWKACPKKWWFRYHEGLVPLAPPHPLTFGRIVHRLLEAHYGDKPLAIVDADPFDLALAQELVNGVLEQDPVGDHTVIGVEEEFIVPIRTKTGRRSPVYRLAGKIDLITRDPHGNVWLWDWKTGSMSLDSDRLRIDDQMSYYLWAMWELGLKPIGIVYYLIRKPTIKPRKGDDYPSYFSRLRNDIHSRPEWYFQKETIVKSPWEIGEISHELTTITHLIQETSNKGVVWRNPKACLIGGCAYRELCIQDSAMARSMGFRIERPHAELKEVVNATS